MSRLQTEQLTPSFAFESGGRRPAHDRMQLQLYRWIKSGGFSPPPGMPEDADRAVEVEAPLYFKGRVTAFVDISVVFWSGPYKVKYALFELKPVIGSVGGLIRQCKTTQALAKLSLLDRETRMPCDASVIAVVDCNDPDLGALREFGEVSVLRWDMQDGKPAA